jgi:hypothetical protein
MRRGSGTTWISDPVDGSRHDNYCQEESGVLLTMDPKNWIGDKDTSETTTSYSMQQGDQ